MQFPTTYRTRPPASLSWSPPPVGWCASGEWRVESGVRLPFFTSLEGAMKTLLFVIPLAFVGTNFWACRSPRQVHEVTWNSNSPSPNAGEADWEKYRKLLFVDQSLEEMVEHYGADDDAFRRAYEHLKARRPEEAKKVLKKILADPAEELRFRLWVWNAL